MTSATTIKPSDISRKPFGLNLITPKPIATAALSTTSWKTMTRSSRIAPRPSASTPKSAKAYFSRGRAYDDKGDYDKAIKDCSAAIRIEPTSAEAYNARGWVFDKADEFDKAYSDFAEAIRLRSDYEQAYNGRGRVYFKRGEYVKAMADFNEAIRLKPDFVNGCNNEGNIFEAKP